MKSKALFYSGIYAFLGIFIAKKLVFQYQFGEEGIDLLPINFFEILLFVLAILIVTITVFTFFRLTKKSKIMITSKVKKHLFFSLLLGSLILFLLLRFEYIQLIIPFGIFIYGLILLHLNRLINSRLFFFALAEIVLGIIAFFIGNNTWLFLILGFGVFPILFGIIQLKTRKSIF